MNPLLTEQHEALRREIREFAEREIAPKAAMLDENEEFSVELTHKMGNAGILGLNMPKRSEEHTSELQSRENLVCRLLLEKKKKQAHEISANQGRDADV